MVGEFDIAGVPLKETLAVVATNYKTVTHWARYDGTFVFYWGDPKVEGAIPLPGPMNTRDCEGFIQSALTTMEYPPEPDCDGHCAKSWRIRHRIPVASVQGMSNWYVAFIVTPHWNEYHK